MCDHFTLRTPLTVAAKQIQFELDFADADLRYNIAPMQDKSVVRTLDGKRELAMLHWGLTSRRPRARILAGYALPQKERIGPLSSFP